MADKMMDYSLNPRGNGGPAERDEGLGPIAGMVANIPDREPPDILIQAVMGRIRPKRMSLFARLRHILRKPLEVTSLKLAPFGAAVAAILLAISLFPDGVPWKPAADPPAVARRAARVNVLFTLSIPAASKVAVIGSFNEWKPDGFQMQRDATQGVWTFALPLEKGRYEYAFLVDGTRMIPDPNALMHEDDGFGGRNSILILERDHDHGNGV